jgi:hypothetical protein
VVPTGYHIIPALLEQETAISLGTGAEPQDSWLCRFVVAGHPCGCVCCASVSLCLLALRQAHEQVDGGLVRLLALLFMFHSQHDLAHRHTQRIARVDDDFTYKIYGFLISNGTIVTSQIAP